MSPSFTSACTCQLWLCSSPCWFCNQVSSVLCPPLFHFRRRPLQGAQPRMFVLSKFPTVYEILWVGHYCGSKVSSGVGRVGGWPTIFVRICFDLWANLCPPFWAHSTRHPGGIPLLGKASGVDPKQACTVSIGPQGLLALHQGTLAVNGMGVGGMRPGRVR